MSGAGAGAAWPARGCDRVLLAKDFFHAVDYLETSPDIDKTRRIGVLRYEPRRVRGSDSCCARTRESRRRVFAAGGLQHNTSPEIQTANFMPRIKIPVLLVNGRDDFNVPEPSSTRNFSRIARHTAGS